MVGERILKLRKEKYWTQKELGERAGIEPKNVGGYESGRLKASRKTLGKFAQAFGMDVEMLIAEPQTGDILAIEDRELVELVRDLNELPEAERVHLKWVLALAVRQHRIQAAMVS